MAQKLYNETSVQNIADAIREKKGYTGKNLLDIQKIVKGRLDNGVIGYESGTTELTLNSDSFSFTTNIYWRGITTDYISANESATYIYSSDFQFNSSTSIFICACYDKDKNWLGNASTLASGDYARKVTTLANTKYIRINIQINPAGTATINNPQLEEGSATPYEPYCRYKIGDMPEEISTISGGGIPISTNISDLNKNIIELYNKFSDNVSKIDEYTPYSNAPATLYSPVSGYDYYFIRYRDSSYQILWFNKFFRLGYYNSETLFWLTYWEIKSSSQLIEEIPQTETIVQETIQTNQITYYISQNYSTLNEAISAIQNQNTNYTSGTTSGGIFGIGNTSDFSKIYTNLIYYKRDSYEGAVVNKISANETIAYI